MNKLWALFDLFRKGSAVTDPALWKKRQITATVLLPLIGALLATAKAFDHEIPISQDDVATLVGGLVVLINVVLTLATSDKIGLPPSDQSPDAAGNNDYAP